MTEPIEKGTMVMILSFVFVVVREILSQEEH
jgi:hypothetical protein